MRMALRRTLVVALTLAVHVGCGGGSGDPSPGPTPPGGESTGVAVDPYLVGAQFQEVTPQGVVVQTSSPSTASGVFTFPSRLTVGNLVRLSVGGQHNGVPYTVVLKRDVDVPDALVVSPLTTLVAGGAMTPAQAVALLDSAVGGNAITAADLFADPMARLLDGAVTDADRKLLAATMAAGAALQVLGGSATQADLAAVVNAVAPKLLEALAATASPAAVASAAAAIADYVGRTAQTVAEVGAAVGNVSASLVTQLVTAAAGGESATIVETGGGLVAGTSAGTIADHLAKGKAALQAALSTHATDKVLEAANRFSAAAALLDADTGASEADRSRARFYGAIARVALLAQPYSDGSADGLQDLGDLLDGFGLGGSRTQRSNLDTFDMETCETVQYGPYYTVEECRLKDLSPTSPRSGELQTFLFQQARPALLGAIALLDGVGAGFSDRIVHDGTSVELDGTDAAFVKGFAAAMLAKIHLQRGYQLDVDIDDLLAREGYDAAAFAADHPLFLTLVDAAALPDARTHALASVAALNTAVARLKAETDDQSDDLIALGETQCTWGGPPYYTYACTTTYNAPDTIAEIEDVLAKIDAALRAEGNHTISLGTVEEPFDVLVNADKLFAGVDLRAAMPTVWNAGALGDRPGPFVDPTFGGLLVSLPFDLNEDLDGDGSPDVFGGYSYFPPGYFAGATFSTGWPFSIDFGPNTHWYGGTRVEFDATEPRFALSFQVQTCDPIQPWICSPGVVSYPGSYEVARNVLTLTFDGAGLSGVQTAIYTAEELGDGHFQGPASYYAAGGGAVVPQWGSWTSWYPAYYW